MSSCSSSDDYVYIPILHRDETVSVDGNRPHFGDSWVEITKKHQSRSEPRAQVQDECPAEDTPRTLDSGNKTTGSTPDANVESNSEGADDFDYLHFTTFLGLKNITIFNSSEITIPTRKKGRRQILQQGMSMDVIRGKLKSGKLGGKAVAIKRARSYEAVDAYNARQRRKRWLEDLYFELQIMTHRPLCDHDNIVGLVGIAFEEGGSLRPVLVVEPAHEMWPDLAKLFGDKESEVVRGLRLKVDLVGLVSDVADGLMALHTYGVAHGDLKPQNILIFPGTTSIYTAKLCDFGASELVTPSTGPGNCSKQYRRTYTKGWTAPELAHHTLPTLPEDIYAFGLVFAFILLRGGIKVPSYLIDPDSHDPRRLIDVVRATLRQEIGCEDEALMVRACHFITLIEEALRVSPTSREGNLSLVRETLLNGDPNGASREIRQVDVIPFRKSIKHDVRESTIVDYHLPNIYQAMMTGYKCLPSNIQTLLVDYIYTTLETVPDIPETHNKLYAARCGYYALYEAAGSKPQKVIPNLGDMSNPLERGALFRRLHDQMNLHHGTDEANALVDDMKEFYESLISSRQVFPEFHEYAQAAARGMEVFVTRYWNLAEITNRRSRNGGWSALHICAANFTPNGIFNDLIGILTLYAGRDIDLNSGRGWTATHVAAYTGNLACLIKLLQLGASGNPGKVIVMGSEWTLLNLVIWQNWVEWSTSKREMPMIRQALQLLLQKGADPWTRDPGRLYNTSAHIACYTPTPISVLLDHDETLLEARNVREETPLYTAAGDGALEGVRVLIARGANIHARNQVGTSVLSYAWHASIDCQRIQSFYFPHSEDIRPMVLQMKQKRFPDLVKNAQAIKTLLIQHGADPDSPLGDFCFGYTPSQSGFIHLSNILGPARANRLWGSCYYFMGGDSAATTNKDAWFEVKVPFETRALYERDISPFYPRQIVRVLKPVLSEVEIVQRIVGVIPLDGEHWDYKVILDMGRLDYDMNDGYTIEITVRVGSDENLIEPATVLKISAPAAVLLPRVAYMYTLELGSIRFKQNSELLLGIRIFDTNSARLVLGRCGGFGGLMLMGMCFELQHSPMFERAAGHRRQKLKIPPLWTRHYHSTNCGIENVRILSLKNLKNRMNIYSPSFAPLTGPALSYPPDQDSLYPRCQPWKDTTPVLYRTRMLMRSLLQEQNPRNSLPQEYGLNALLNHIPLIAIYPRVSPSWVGLPFWLICMVNRSYWEDQELRLEGWWLSYIQFLKLNLILLFTEVAVLGAMLRFTPFLSEGSIGWVFYILRIVVFSRGLVYDRSTNTMLFARSFGRIEYTSAYQGFIKLLFTAMGMQMRELRPYVVTSVVVLLYPEWIVWTVWDLSFRRIGHGRERDVVKMGALVAVVGIIGSWICL